MVEAPSGSQYGAYGVSRFANLDVYGSDYSTPGWKRAQAARERCRARAARARDARRTRQAARDDRGRSDRALDPRFALFVGARVFHLKFGPGSVAAVDGNKLTVDFDKAGRKMVLESFVEAG